MNNREFHITDISLPKFKYGDIHIPSEKNIENGVLLPPTKHFVCHVKNDDTIVVIKKETINGGCEVG